MKSKHIEIKLANVSFIAEYNPNNALVYSISYNEINCKSYMGDEEYELFFEEIQEQVSQIVE